MTRLRSGPLAAWASSWLAGAAAADEVLRACVGEDGSHQVVGLGGDDPTPLSELLIFWRKQGEPVRLVLPVAGDIRGVPGPAGFRGAALAAGEGVHGGGIGLVPDVFDPSPSSAPVSVTWHACPVETPPPDYIAVPDAQEELATAIRESATALAAARVAAATDEIAAGLQEARRAGERVNLPPGHPPRAVALVAQAERLQAIVDLAALDPVGAAVDQAGIAARAEALRPLTTAVRRARLAGYNAGYSAGAN